MEDFCKSLQGAENGSFHQDGCASGEKERLINSTELAARRFEKLWGLMCYTFQIHERKIIEMMPKFAGNQTQENLVPFTDI